VAKQGEDWADRSLGVFLMALKKLAPVCILMVVVGLIPLVIVGLSSPAGFARVVGGGAMAGAAAFVAGGQIGFLFGIPRVLETDAEPLPSADGVPRSRYRVNTNLEQISDWLTKILVGVGLTQLPKIADACGRLITAVADGMGGGTGMTSLAGAVLIFFLGNGFLGAYYLTRTTFTVSFWLSDVELSRFEDRMQSTEQATQDAKHQAEQLARDVQALQQGTDGTIEDLKRPAAG
jgi:hypothetical protein